MSINITKTQNTILEYLKNPFVCAGIIGIAAYYFYSSCYITKENIRSKFSIKKQRTANIKCALYLFILACIILFLFRYLNNDKPEQISGGMLNGPPPF